MAQQDYKLSRNAGWSALCRCSVATGCSIDKKSRQLKSATVGEVVSARISNFLRRNK